MPLKISHNAVINAVRAANKMQREVMEGVERSLADYNQGRLDMLNCICSSLDAASKVLKSGTPEDVHVAKAYDHLSKLFRENYKS